MSPEIRIILIIFLFQIVEARNNPLIEINDINLIQIHKPSFIDPQSGTGYLLDSKIQGTKAIFLSSPILQILYYSIEDLDKMIHVIQMDFSSSPPIILSSFLKLSSYISFSFKGSILFSSKILNVDPLILYINYCKIN